MKKLLLSILIIMPFISANAQVSVTTVAGNYKAISIGNNVYGDYTRAIILLHEMYNSTNINANYAIGTITALRGSSGFI